MSESACSSLRVGAIAFRLMLGGWASGSKYSFLGAMRAPAKRIFLRGAMGRRLVGVPNDGGDAVLNGSSRRSTAMWYSCPFVGFLILIAPARRDQPRAVDLTEADAELPPPSPVPPPPPPSLPPPLPPIAGYNTEYARKFATTSSPSTLNISCLGDRGERCSGRMADCRRHRPPNWVDPFVSAGRSRSRLLFVGSGATLPRLR